MSRPRSTGSPASRCVRGIRQQLHWHENPLYRFASGARSRPRPARAAQRRPPRRLRLRPSTCRSSPPRWPARPSSPPPARDVTFVLQHAGMLEDLSERGRRRLAGRHALLAARPNVVSKLSGFGTFMRRNDPGAYRAASLTRRWRSSARSAASSARTSRSRSSGPSYRELIAAIGRRRAAQAARPQAVFHDTASAGLPALSTEGEGTTMALEIKILDYGDIELESSFLVLGRDCGRTAAGADLRLPDPRRALAGRGRHRLPRQRDHGDARHARPPVPREHDREPARPARREDRRRALRPAHPPAHRPRRQGRPLPDEHHRGHQPPRAGILGLRPDAPAIPDARHQAPGRAAAHPRRAALRGSRAVGPDRAHPRRASWRRPAPTPRAR